MSVELSAIPPDATSDTPPTSAYEYIIQCSFQALHPPDIKRLVYMLRKHHDYVGFMDKIALLSEIGKVQISSSQFWDPFAVKVIAIIRECITSKVKLLGKMMKQLTLMDRTSIREFATAHAKYFSSDSIGFHQCLALINVLCSAFISLLKHDMCQGISHRDISVAGIINKAFSVAEDSIELCFSSFCIGSDKSAQSLRESLYYVAGWHAHTLQKASVRRRDVLRSLLISLYNTIDVGKDRADKECMPIQKFERVELFGGLKYVSRAYFIFILRMEYVFMNMFTAEKLVMMGSDLISNVYTELLASVHVKRIIVALDSTSLGEADEVDLHDIVIHMTRTYCRMRGKDFVRKFMQRGFKNKNLGKGIRPTLAILSNPSVKKAIGKSHAVGGSNVTQQAIHEDDLLTDEDIDTLMEYTCGMLINDDFVTTDDNNLYQEC